MTIQRTERDTSEAKYRRSHLAGRSLLLKLLMSVSQVPTLAVVTFVPASNKMVMKTKLVLDLRKEHWANVTAED